MSLISEEIYRCTQLHGISRGSMPDCVRLCAKVIYYVSVDVVSKVCHYRAAQEVERESESIQCPFQSNPHPLASRRVDGPGNRAINYAQIGLRRASMSTSKRTWSSEVS